MSNKVATRTGRDRIRYAITFEMGLMAMLIPAGAAFFDKAMTDIGILGVVLSLKAMLLSLAYNWLFDRVDARAGRVSSQRSLVGRVMHAVGFEVSLTITSLPIYVWWLNIGFLDALAADIVVTTFVVVYTYAFTLAYDRFFPLECPQSLIRA